MISGNKGEWTEIYVFLKLLAIGELDADHILNDLPTSALEIIKIIRKEHSGHRDYEIEENLIQITDAESGKAILHIPRDKFKTESNKLLKNIQDANGRTHQFPDIEYFLKNIDVNTLSAPSEDKSDIRLVVYDFKTGQKPTLGYSIKSAIGKPATLFNPAAGTNFIFKITPPSADQIDINKINKETLEKSIENKSLSKISLRVKALHDLGCKFEFVKIQSTKLELNLSLIDSDLPKLLSYFLLYRYLHDTKNTSELANILNDQNPFGYNLEFGHQFYHHKLKKFLSDAALGMTPEKIWDGVHDTTGGFIIVRPKGELGCYHIYNKNDFDLYLINGTRLEQASTGEDKNNPGKEDPNASKKYYFGWIYEENNDLYIKLNLQVRFL